VSVDLERLASVADMHGAHVRLRRQSRARKWTVSVVTDVAGLELASSAALTVTGAVLACLAKLRAKETDHAE
jgi:hypothetical protein